MHDECAARFDLVSRRLDAEPGDGGRLRVGHLGAAGEGDARRADTTLRRLVAIHQGSPERDGGRDAPSGLLRITGPDVTRAPRALDLGHRDQRRIDGRGSSRPGVEEQRRVAPCGARGAGSGSAEIDVALDALLAGANIRNVRPGELRDGDSDCDVGCGTGGVTAARRREGGSRAEG